MENPLNTIRRSCYRRPALLSFSLVIMVYATCNLLAQSSSMQEDNLNVLAGREEFRSIRKMLNARP